MDILVLRAIVDIQAILDLRAIVDTPDTLVIRV